MLDGFAGWLCILIVLVLLHTMALGALDVPLQVAELDGLSRHDEPIAAGVPLPMGAVGDAGKLALVGGDGEAVPADFTVLQNWGDGSVKWVLCDWLATLGAGESATYRLRDDVEPAAPQKALYVDNDTNEVTIDTGVLRFILNKHGFDGFAKAWMSPDRKGRLSPTSHVIAGHRDTGGLVAMGADGKTVYASRWGRVRSVEVERQGKLHVTLCVKGDMRSRDGERFLDYAMHISAQAGSSRVRIVCTVHNPRPCGRINGDRWVLGQSGSALFESLDFVIPVETQGLQRVTLEAEPGRMWDRLPDPNEVVIYQDSSGGENWFHRTHVNRDNRIPLQYRGWRASCEETRIGEGLRAEPWLDLSDMRWGVAVAVPKFWQNFPKALGVKDGDIRVGLWPGEFADLHELQGGEQKTHEWTVYFHHRGKTRFGVMPHARSVMPAVHKPLQAWAPSEWYFSTGAFEPHVPYDPQRFRAYEALVQGGVTAEPTNLFTHREEADEYGWRHYGDTWARNERDKTGGPHDGLDVVSHYNHEYDHGYWMTVQCLRTVDSGGQLWPAWWELGRSGLWHEADIDLYHCKDDLTEVYNGGKFTHQAHGVDAGRSTHRGSPRDELWGLLDWAWKRGSSPESGHFNTRGIVYMYLLTGDRHLLDASWELAELVTFKIEKNRFAQITTPGRNAGHNLQILTDAYMLSGDDRYLLAADKLISSCRPERVMGRGRGRYRPDWGTAIYIQALDRHIQMLKKENGVDHKEGIETVLGYAGAVLDREYGQDGLNWEDRRWRGWPTRLADMMMIGSYYEPDPARRQGYLDAAGAAFASVDRRVGDEYAPVFVNSKAHTILIGGGGRYMDHASRQPAGGN